MGILLVGINLIIYFQDVLHVVACLILFLVYINFYMCYLHYEYILCFHLFRFFAYY